MSLDIMLKSSERIFHVKMYASMMWAQTHTRIIFKGKAQRTDDTLSMMWLSLMNH